MTDVFRGFKTVDDLDGDYHRDPLGVLTPRDYSPYLLRRNAPIEIEELVEWNDLLESVRDAEDSYCFVEAGAGWGKWTVRANWAMLQEHPLMPTRVIAVEADANHLKRLRNHLDQSNVKNGEIVTVALSDTAGESQWLTAHGYMGAQLLKERWKLIAAVVIGCFPSSMRRILSRVTGRRMRDWYIKKVKTYTLDMLLTQIESVDFLDMDIQGAEGRVLEAGLDTLQNKVKRVRIETHSSALDNQVSAIFKSLGWEKLYAYPFGQISETPWGKGLFKGGAQGWRNKT